MWKIFSFLKMFREDLLVMMVALKDSRTPAAIKAAFLLGLLYCISPIDIIPDAVPVLGMVDDAAVLPAAVFGLIRFLPPHVRADAQVTQTESAISKTQRILFIQNTSQNETIKTLYAL